MGNTDGTICGEPNPKGLLCRFPVHDAGLHSWEAASGEASYDGPDSVRKGALAEDRMSRSPEVAVACDDLARLADFGALAGVAEIIRERLRQIEVLGFTPEHDRQHDNGWLLAEVAARVTAVISQMLAGTAGYPEIEEALREAGSFAAAEMDRLLRLLTPEEETDAGK